MLTGHTLSHKLPAPAALQAPHGQPGRLSGLWRQIRTLGAMFGDSQPCQPAGASRATVALKANRQSRPGRRSLVARDSQIETPAAMDVAAGRVPVRPGAADAPASASYAPQVEAHPTRAADTADVFMAGSVAASATATGTDALPAVANASQGSDGRVAAEVFTADEALRASGAPAPDPLPAPSGHVKSGSTAEEKEEESGKAKEDAADTDVTAASDRQPPPPKVPAEPRKRGRKPKAGAPTASASAAGQEGPRKPKGVRWTEQRTLALARCMVQVVVWARSQPTLTDNQRHQRLLDLAAEQPELAGYSAVDIGRKRTNVISMFRLVCKERVRAAADPAGGDSGGEAGSGPGTTLAAFQRIRSKLRKDFTPEVFAALEPYYVTPGRVTSKNPAARTPDIMQVSTEELQRLAAALSEAAAAMERSTAASRELLQQLQRVAQERQQVSPGQPRLERVAEEQRQGLDGQMMFERVNVVQRLREAGLVSDATARAMVAGVVAALMPGGGSGQQVQPSTEEGRRRRGRPARNAAP